VRAAYQLSPTLSSEMTGRTSDLSAADATMNLGR